jgi:hypothetical protein
VFEYIEGWYNPRRRHSTLGYLSPAEYEQQHAEHAAGGSNSANGWIASIAPRGADGVTPRRLSTVRFTFAGDGPMSPENPLTLSTVSAQTAPHATQETKPLRRPLRRVVTEEAR